MALDITVMRAAARAGRMTWRYHALMRMQDDNQPLYVSAGFDAADQRLYVITVRWLDPRTWEDPWRRRRKTP